MKSIVNKAVEEYALKVEGAIKVCLKPRPKFIPEKLWLRIVSRFIYLEEVMPKVTYSQTK